jgi:hypothetical protein
MNGYNYRRDNRTDEQFAKDIKDRTNKQRTLIEVFKNEMDYRKRNVVVYDYGIDNNGGVVKGSAGCDPDYLVIFDDKKTRLLEVQASNVDTKATFKVDNLKSYADQGVIILLFLNTNNETIVSKDTRWAIISNKKIKEMLADKQNSVYTDPLFGNKRCLRLHKGEFHKYFETYRLLHLQ